MQCDAYIQQFHEKCRTNSLKTFHSDARSVIFVTSPTYYEHQLGSESSGARVYMWCAANCLTIYVTTNIGVKIAFHFDVHYTFVHLMPFTSLPFRIYFFFFFIFFENKNRTILLLRYTRLKELWLCECSLIFSYAMYVIFMPYIYHISGR